MALLTIVRTPFNPENQVCVLTRDSTFTNPDCKGYMKKNLEKGVHVTITGRLSKAQEVDDFAGVARDVSADFIILDLNEIYYGWGLDKELQLEEWESCRVVENRVYRSWNI